MPTNNINTDHSFYQKCDRDGGGELGWGVLGKLGSHSHGGMSTQNDRTERRKGSDCECGVKPWRSVWGEQV